MHIGLEVQRTERAHQGVSLALDRQQFPGTAGNNDLWHSVQRKQNTWQQVKLHVGYLDEKDLGWFVWFSNGSDNDSL